MSFTLSGSQITQSGTDANISGLAGIAGVTVTSVAGRKIYNVGNKSLYVTGTLTQDNRVEEILFGSSAPSPTVNVTGTYNVGAVISYGGKETYTVGSPFTFTKTGGLSYKDYDSNLICRASGTLNLYGCSIRLSGGRSIWYEIGAHGIIRETHVYALGDARAYMLSASLDIKGYYCYDLNATNFNSAMVQLKNYIPYNVRFPFFFNGPKNAGPTLYVENFERYGNTTGDQQGQCAAKYIYQNKVEGADTLEVYCRGRPNDNDFVVELRKDILINAKSDTGAPLSNTKFFSRDVNNGSRLDFWAGTAATDTVYIPDRTYAFTTDAAGKGVSQDYLSAVVVGNNTPAIHNFNKVPLNPMTVDDRGENGIAIFGGILYSKLIAAVPIALKGANVTEVTWPFFWDPNVTEEKGIVDNYTVINDAMQLYDRAKSYLYDNYAGELETLVQREGGELVSPNFNIVLDKTASTLFSITGDTITVKCNVFRGGIIAKGITIKNGATISLGIYSPDILVDAGADTTLQFNDVAAKADTLNIDVNHTLTINIDALSSVTTTTPGTGNGQVNLVEALATLEVTSLVPGSYVKVTKVLGGDLLFKGSETSGSIIFDTAYIGEVEIVARKASSSPYYEQYTTRATLTGTSVSVPALQQLD